MAYRTGNEAERMMILDNKFEFGQTVYLTTDTDQLPRIVTAMNVNPGLAITYQLSQGANNSWHFDFEIAVERDVMVSTNN